MAENFESLSFLFVPRECNKVVDGIAKYARRNEINEVWKDMYPEWIIALVS